MFVPNWSAARVYDPGCLSCVCGAGATLSACLFYRTLCGDEVPCCSTTGLYFRRQGSSWRSTQAAASRLLHCPGSRSMTGTVWMLSRTTSRPTSTMTWTTSGWVGGQSTGSDACRATIRRLTLRCCHNPFDLLQHGSSGLFAPWCLCNSLSCFSRYNSLQLNTCCYACGPCFHSATSSEHPNA